MVTIETKFNETILPKWARKNKAVVEMCKKDLAFRCNVCSAETQQMRTFLRWQAESVMEVLRLILMS